MGRSGDEKRNILWGWPYAKFAHRGSVAPLIAWPRILLSCATCTYSAQFLNALHNN